MMTDQRKTHIHSTVRHAGATLGLYATVCGIEVYGVARVVVNPRDATCLTCRRFLAKPKPATADLGFIDHAPTPVSAMRRSIHKSHRGEGQNFVD